MKKTSRKQQEAVNYRTWDSNSVIETAAAPTQREGSRRQGHSDCATHPQLHCLFVFLAQPTHTYCRSVSSNTSSLHRLPHPFPFVILLPSYWIRSRKSSALSWRGLKGLVCAADHFSYCGAHLSPLAIHAFEGFFIEFDTFCFCQESTQLDHKKVFWVVSEFSLEYFVVLFQFSTIVSDYPLLFFHYPWNKQNLPENNDRHWEACPFRRGGLP